MSEHSQNNPNAPKIGATHAVRKIGCEEWEAMLTDFLDGTLLASDLETFHAHDRSCDPCTEMLSQAQQGREWLGFLRVEPPVPSALVARILSQTSGSVAQAQLGDVVAPASVVAIPVAPVLPFWRRYPVVDATRRVAQPRLMMTAAMAFFSITLTLNMAGVRLSAVRLADLKPAALSTNLDKQYHMASARVVRYYDSLRFVYEMEAKVRELRRDSDLENSTPAEKPAQQPAPSGSSEDTPHKNGGKSEGPSNSQPQPMFWGEAVEAELRLPRAVPQDFQQDLQQSTEQHSASNPEIADARYADQVERGTA